MDCGKAMAYPVWSRETRKKKMPLKRNGNNLRKRAEEEKKGIKK